MTSLIKEKEIDFTHREKENEDGPQSIHIANTAKAHFERKKK